MPANPVWTPPADWTAGEVVTAAKLNQQLRDNLAYLRALLTGQLTDTVTLGGDLVLNGRAIYLRTTTTPVAVQLERTDTGHIGTLGIAIAPGHYSNLAESNYTVLRSSAGIAISVGTSANNYATGGIKLYPSGGVGIGQTPVDPGLKNVDIQGQLFVRGDTTDIKRYNIFTSPARTRIFSDLTRILGTTASTISANILDDGTAFYVADSTKYQRILSIETTGTWLYHSPPSSSPSWNVVLGIPNDGGLIVGDAFNLPSPGYGSVRVQNDLVVGRAIRGSNLTNATVATGSVGTGGTGWYTVVSVTLNLPTGVNTRVMAVGTTKIGSGSAPGRIVIAGNAGPQSLDGNSVNVSFHSYVTSGTITVDLQVYTDNQTAWGQLIVWCVPAN